MILGAAAQRGRSSKRVSVSSFHRFRARSTKGYKFKDSLGTVDGITKVQLKGGDAGKSKLIAVSSAYPQTFFAELVGEWKPDEEDQEEEELLDPLGVDEGADQRLAEDREHVQELRRRHREDLRLGVPHEPVPGRAGDPHERQERESGDPADPARSGRSSGRA